MVARKWIGRVLSFAATFVALGILVVAGVGLFYGLPVSLADRPALVGNLPSIVEQAQKRAGASDFRFAVIGDIQTGPEIFERLLEIAREKSPAFLVLLGDVVCSANPVEHKLFWREMHEANLPFPVLFVPGNHDAGRAVRFSLPDFETAYGRAQFDFTIGENLFVFLNNAVPLGSVEYLKYARDVLSNKAKGMDNVFVFCHVPPVGPFGAGRRGVAGGEAFTDLMEQRGVRYVFSGHDHTCLEATRGRTTYVISGGGGARLEDEAIARYHMVLVNVRGREASHEIVPLGKTSNVADRFERNVALHLWPLMAASTGAIAITALLVLAAATWLAYRLVRWIGGHRRPDSLRGPCNSTTGER